ncbi:MAG: hypothetical protein JSS69_12905 [Acidobacteria bacterium]|nr:hypothetical protein [Acidobacteriota bacterium]
MNQPTRIKGRGAASNSEGRFETTAREAVDDGWEREAETAPHPATTVTEERARSIISRNESPDIPFEQSINPYRGCEHEIRTRVTRKFIVKGRRFFVLIQL